MNAVWWAVVGVVVGVLGTIVALWLYLIKKWPR